MNKKQCGRLALGLFVAITLAAAMLFPAVHGQTDSWEILENVGDDEALNHNWNESDYSQWAVYNDTTHDEVYRWKPTGAADWGDELGWTVVNNTACNRSQSLVWAYTNDSSSYIGNIYAWDNDSDMAYAILYGANNIYTVDVNLSNNTIWDSETGTNLTNGATGGATDHWSADSGDFDPTASSGLWIKTIYDHRGQLMSKIWTPFESEPTYWDLDSTDSAYRHDQIQPGRGLFVWNADNNSIHAYFDDYSLWNLTYTLNASDVPLMEFPSINMATIWDTYNNISSGYMAANLTNDTAASFLRSNWYNYFNLESHIWYNTTGDSSDQNDNIYYRSACVYNISTFLSDLLNLTDEEESGIPYSLLFIHVEDCSDGDDNYNDSCRVWFDIDDDDTWSSNDRMYWWGGNNSDKYAYRYTNTSLDADDNALTVANFPTGPDMGYMHRYNSHKHYQIMLPIDDLVKSNGQYINKTDIFGLHIDVSDNDSMIDIPIWEAWNETSNSTVAGSESHNFTAPWYPSEHYTDGVPNTENMSRWGVATIVDSDGTYPGGYLDPKVTKKANKEIVAPGGQVNFTITIENTGDVDVTNVTLTEDYGSYLSFVDSSIDAANITNSNQTFNVTDSLASGATETLWILCNVSSDVGQGTYITNNVTVTTDEGTTNYGEVTIRSSSYDKTTTTILNDILPILVGILLLMTVIGLGVTGSLTKESAITLLIAIVLGMTVLLVILQL